MFYFTSSPTVKLQHLLVVTLFFMFSSLGLAHTEHEEIYEEISDIEMIIDDSDTESDEAVETKFNLKRFVGRFHPLLIHFPITLLLIAAASEWWFCFTKQSVARKMGLINLWIGTLTSILAALTGWILASSKKFSGEDAQLLLNHRWLGVSVVVISILTLCGFYLLKKYTWRDKLYIVLLTVVASLVGLTAHFGGSLIYGSDYLVP